MNQILALPCLYLPRASYFIKEKSELPQCLQDFIFSGLLFNANLIFYFSQFHLLFLTQNTSLTSGLSSNISPFFFFGLFTYFGLVPHPAMRGPSLHTAFSFGLIPSLCHTQVIRQCWESNLTHYAQNMHCNSLNSVLTTQLSFYRRYIQTFNCQHSKIIRLDLLVGLSWFGGCTWQCSEPTPASNPGSLKELYVVPGSNQVDHVQSKHTISCNISSSLIFI